MEQQQEEPKRRPLGGSKIGQLRPLDELYLRPPLLGTLRRRLLGGSKIGQPRSPELLFPKPPPPRKRPPEIGGSSSSG